MKRQLCLAFVAALSLACRERDFGTTTPHAAASDPRETAFVAAAWDDLDLGELDRPEVRANLAQGARRSIGWLQGRHAPTTIHYGARALTSREAAAGHEAFLASLGEFHDSASFKASLAQKFDLVRSVGRENGTTLFTGYYVESLDGSLTPVEGHTPAYGIPPDLTEADAPSLEPSRAGNIVQGLLLFNPARGMQEILPVPAVLPEGARVVNIDTTRWAPGTKKIRGRMEGDTLVPYYTRAEIRSERKLEGRGLEVAWISNPIDLFFTEIQGSGILHLPNGTKRLLHYATQNGHKYRAIGRLLRDEGSLPPDGVTMQSIYAWLLAHPEEQERVFNYNESFVFFEVTDGGAKGYADLELTPEHSLAADLDYFPHAGLGFISLPKPKVGEDGTVGHDGRIDRMAYFQDTGGAIKGPGRIDIFWGDSPEAKAMAGITQHEGQVYLLVPRADPTLARR